jgi:hypothetical protein
VATVQDWMLTDARDLEAGDDHGELGDCNIQKVSSHTSLRQAGLYGKSDHR